MKRLVVLAVIALGVVSAYRRQRADRAEAQLWAEATSPPDLRFDPAPGT